MSGAYPASWPTAPIPLGRPFVLDPDETLVLPNGATTLLPVGEPLPPIVRRRPVEKFGLLVVSFLLLGLGALAGVGILLLILGGLL